MKRTKARVLAAVLSAAMVTSTGFANVVMADAAKAVTPISSRIAGSDRYATSNLIADQFSSADTVVVANGDDFPDALCAAPLARLYKAPILLASTKGGLSSASIAEITRLGATKVIVVGGTGAVPSSVESQVGINGVTVSRIAGKDRYDTSLMVAKLLPTPKSVVVAYGENYPDALSISSVAATLEMPIILSRGTGLSEEARAYIESTGAGTTYVVGGTGVLSSNVESQVPGPVRLGGPNRYATELAILNQFRSVVKFDTVYLATGENFADALSGAALSSLTGSPVILISSEMSPELAAFIAANVEEGTSVIALGGESAVSSAVVNQEIQSIVDNGRANDIKSGKTTPTTPATPTTPVVSGGGSSGGGGSYGGGSSTSYSSAKIISATKIGILAGTTITGIPQSTTVSNLLAGLTISTSATTYVITSSTGATVDGSSTITSGMSIVVRAQDGSTSSYTLSVLNTATLATSLVTAKLALASAQPYLVNKYAGPVVTQWYSRLASDCQYAETLIAGSVVASQGDIDKINATVLQDIDLLKTALTSGISVIPADTVTVTVNGIQEIAPITVAFGTNLSSIKLPDAIVNITTTGSAITTASSTVTEPTVWDDGTLEGHTFNGNIAGTYNLRGRVTMPTGAVVPSGVTTSASINIVVSSLDVVTPTVVSVTAIPDVTVPYGSGVTFPLNILVNTTTGTTTAAITWSGVANVGTTVGTTTYKGTLVMPAGYLNPNSVLASIKVTVLPIAALSSAKDITTFIASGEIGNAVINSSLHTVVFHVAYGSTVSNVGVSVLSNSTTTGAITVNGASVYSNSTYNFGSPVTFDVKAEDGTVQSWIATCIIDAMRVESVESFTGFDIVVGSPVSSLNLPTTVSVTTSGGITALPVVWDLGSFDSSTHGGKTLHGTVTLDSRFVNPAGYEPSLYYTVNSETADFMSFVVPSEVGSTSINPVSHTITIHVSNGTSVYDLKPVFTTDGRDVDKAVVSGISNISGITAVDMTSPVIYTITAESGVTQDWIVTCLVDAPVVVDKNVITVSTYSVGEVANGTMVAGLSLPSTTQVKVDGNLPVSMPVTWDTSSYSPTTVGLQTIPGTLVPDAGYTNTLGLTASATVTVDAPAALSATKAITTFSVSGEVGVATIDSANHTISFHMPDGTNVKTLVSTLTSDSVLTSPIFVGTTSQVSGQSINDFTNPVVYTVKAEDGTTQTWTATCVVDVDTVTVHDDDVNQTVIVDAIDQGMFVQIDVVDVTQVKGVKVKLSGTYKDPNVAWTVDGNTIEMYGQSNSTDGYVYIQLLNGSQYKATIN